MRYSKHKIDSIKLGNTNNNYSVSNEVQIDLNSNNHKFLGFEGLKEFITSNDKKLIDKILFDLQKFDKKDNKINLISLKFSVESYGKRSKELKSRLTTTTIDCFHMINEFAKVHIIKKK